MEVEWKTGVERERESERECGRRRGQRGAKHDYSTCPGIPPIPPPPSLLSFAAIIFISSSTILAIEGRSWISLLHAFFNNDIIATGHKTELAKCTLASRYRLTTASVAIYRLKNST